MNNSKNIIISVLSIITLGALVVAGVYFSRYQMASSYIREIQLNEPLSTTQEVEPIVNTPSSSPVLEGDLSVDQSSSEILTDPVVPASQGASVMAAASPVLQVGDVYSIVYPNNGTYWQATIKNIDDYGMNEVWVENIEAPHRPGSTFSDVVQTERFVVALTSGVSQTDMENINDTFDIVVEQDWSTRSDIQPAYAEGRFTLRLNDISTYHVFDVMERYYATGLFDSVEYEPVNLPD